jgi:hypothetical protein
MKHVFLLIFISASLFTNAQIWAPEGATWHYNFSSFWVEGHIKIEKIGDTLINDINCDILQRESHTYNFISEEYSSGITGLEFTYEADSVVYFYRDGEFHTLYDFGAEAGDSWTVPADVNCAEDQIVVDSVEWVEINGEEQKKLHIHSVDNHQFLGDEIIEKMGSMTYMFPIPYCVTDVALGGPFRCYSDDEGFSYSINPEVDCDFIIGVDEMFNELSEIELFPNPASDFISVKIPSVQSEELELTLYNSLGKTVEVPIQNSREMRIDVRALSNGIYFLRIQSGKSVAVEKFYKR